MKGYDPACSLLYSNFFSLKILFFCFSPLPLSCPWTEPHNNGAGILIRDLAVFVWQGPILGLGRHYLRARWLATVVQPLETKQTTIQIHPRPSSFFPPVSSDSSSCLIRQLRVFLVCCWRPHSFRFLSPPLRFSSILCVCQPFSSSTKGLFAFWP